MKLYEINSLIENCIKVSDDEAVDTTTGEIVSIDYLEHLEMDKAEKIENIIKFYLNLKAEAEALKAEADKFKKRYDSAVKKADQLKAYLGYCQNGEKFKSADGLHSLSFRNTESVEVININNIPENYLIPQEPKPDKKAIKEAIKHGIEIDGCQLVEGKSITIK